MNAGSASVVRVAFNAKVHTLFDYRIPIDAPENIVGRRVRAEFGRRLAVGVAMEVAFDTAVCAEKLKRLNFVYDDMPPLPPASLALIRFCADYYHCPIGIAAAAVLPVFFRRNDDYKPPTGYRLALPPPAGEIPAGKNAPLLLALLGEHGEMSLSMIRQHLAAPQAALKKLLVGGWINRCYLWGATESRADIAADSPPLTADQQRALGSLRLREGFVPHLLFGVTGSGKTEIYLRAVESVLEAGRQALVLTPEIHLTPQLEDEFSRRFPGRRLCVLHSGLADGERAHRWLMARTGVADIVLGTRLAVFTPMPRLGLIVVDEEHDDSYKQEDGLLFSARNVAVWRAKNEAVPYLAGSATPSLESYESARQQKAVLLTLSERAVSYPLTIETTPVNEDVNNYHGMTPAFLHALRDCLAAGKQALVFINRRGYAPCLACRGCGKRVECRRCNLAMTLHRRRGLLCCHLCGATEKIPPDCSNCGDRLMPLGVGTQRVEEALGRLFPDIPQLRLDSDSMTTGKFHQVRQEIAAGKWRLLIGTQIIAKGHNFPKLAFIGVLNADSGLTAADFRAEERLFALLSQVIGRGTRNPEGCRVLLQTRYPSHPFFADVKRDDVDCCWQRLLTGRQRAVLPPFSYLALLMAKHKNPVQLESFMDKAAAVAAKCCPPGVHIADAVPPLIEKIGGWHRRQIMVMSSRRQLLHRFLGDWQNGIRGSVHWRIDVDPINV